MPLKPARLVVPRHIMEQLMEATEEERDAIQRDIDRIASAYGLGPAQIEVVDPPRTTRRAEGDDGPPALNRAGRRAHARRR